MHGTLETLAAGRILSVRGSRTRGGYTTCTGASGNTAEIFLTLATTGGRPKTIRPDRQPVLPLCRAGGNCIAGAADCRSSLRYDWFLRAKADAVGMRVCLVGSQ